jgi:Domain of unknown function (DUF4271)
MCHAQIVKPNAVPSVFIDTILKVNAVKNINTQLIDSNTLLNTKGQPIAYNVLPKKRTNKEVFFYFTAFLCLIFGIVRTFYRKYFKTLFKVFFNTSLRQNQLTDQLEQSSLPSLIFNILFSINTGIFIFLLIKHNSSTIQNMNFLYMLLCILAVASAYIIKFLTLKFTGWVTQYTTEANTYIFVIFLLNKIIGIFLLPIIIIIIFSTTLVASYAILFAFIVIGLLLLMRFYRSFSLLQSKLQVSPFHFFLYIISLEILPLLLIYKTVMMYLA